MKIDLGGKHAIVTGSTRGIGLAIARTLADAGARVAIVGRDEARASEVAASIGEGAKGFGCDLSDVEQASQLVDRVEKSVAPVDILVNNAGLTRDNLMLRMSDADWQAVIDANLRAAFLTMRAATKSMMRRKWGRVVNISSVVGLTGNKGQANYAASKAGLIGLSKSVAKEFASRNILVNVIAPGFIETDMTAQMTPEARQTFTAAIPLGRLGTGENVAGAVAFLCSDLAAYITGQVITVDGGLTM